MGISILGVPVIVFEFVNETVQAAGITHRMARQWRKYSNYRVRVLPATARVDITCEPTLVMVCLDRSIKTIFDWIKN